MADEFVHVPLHSNLEVLPVYTDALENTLLYPPDKFTHGTSMYEYVFPMFMNEIGMYDKLLVKVVMVVPIQFNSSM